LARDEQAMITLPVAWSASEAVGPDEHTSVVPITSARPGYFGAHHNREEVELALFDSLLSI
jgi:hypothetical protein